jgi:hypothetical protein
MSFPVQQSLFGHSLPVGDLERRIVAAYHRNPKVADSDKLLALELWCEEGLAEAIKDGVESFKRWFLEDTTGFESISRASRKLRAAGIIRASPEVTEARRQLAEAHRQYWRQK